MSGRRHIQGSFEFYSQVIKKLGRLDDKTLHLLAQNAREGDTNSRNEIVSHNLGLIFDFMKKNNRFYGKGALEHIDLIQIALVGLIKAAQVFDEKKGSFSTCAWTKINEALRKAIRDDSQTVRMSEYKVRQKREIERVADQLCLSLGRTATSEEIADFVGVSEDVVTGVLSLKIGTISLSQDVGDKKDQPLEGIFNPSHVKGKKESPLDAIEMEENLLEVCSRIRRIKNLIKSSKLIKDGHKGIFLKKYGLDDNSFEKRNSAEVGGLLNPPITRQEIDRIIGEIWKRLEVKKIERNVEKGLFAFMGSEDWQEITQRFKEKTGKSIELQLN